jgi:hypothetical protein
MGAEVGAGAVGVAAGFAIVADGAPTRCGTDL